MLVVVENLPSGNIRYSRFEGREKTVGVIVDQPLPEHIVELLRIKPGALGL